MTSRQCGVFLALLLVAGCGSGERPASAAGDGPIMSAPGPRTTSETPLSGDDVATGSCDAQSPRDCRLSLPEVNGIKNCFSGTQVCIDSVWSKCLSDEDAAALLAEGD